MAATVQAKRVAETLKGIGLKHGSWRNGGDFTVRTDTKRILDRSSGRRYSEFGDAMAHVHSREACAKVEAHAQEIADLGLGVILLYHGDKLTTVVVSSRYNPTCEVSVNRDGAWLRLAKAAV